MLDWKNKVEQAWQDRQFLQQPGHAEAVRSVIGALDRGELRVASPGQPDWELHEWVKQAILLYFSLQPMKTWSVPPFEFYDKIDLKKGFAALGVRAVPHAVARYGSFIARNVVLMPSYVNIGAYVDEGSMVDTWATVGSCAQIGKGVHLSGGVGIGGGAGAFTGGPSDYRRRLLYRIPLHCRGRSPCGAGGRSRGPSCAHQKHPHYRRQWTGSRRIQRENSGQECGGAWYIPQTVPFRGIPGQLRPDYRTAQTVDRLEDQPQ